MRSCRAGAAAFLVLAQAAVAVQRFRTKPADGAACVVFHSQHKSGGATIEQKLSRYPLKATDVKIDDWNPCHTCKLHCDRENWDCLKQTCLGTGKDYTPYSSNHVAFRGYTPLLAGTDEWGSPGDGKCIWATMSRDPISRLVSAFYYCKYGWNNDPLCGSSRLDPNNATLHEFAKHWGNFLFREFLWFPELRALATSRDDYKPENHCKDDKGWSDPWVAYKDQLNGGDDPRTKSGAANFKAVKDRLSSGKLYDVYGVLERYNETMALFDEHLPFKGTTWMYENLVHGMHAAHGSVGREGGSNAKIGWRDDENRDIASAREDPFILAELAADITLYNEIILPMFDKSTEHLKTTLTQIMKDAVSGVDWQTLVATRSKASLHYDY